MPQLVSSSTQTIGSGGLLEVIAEICLSMVDGRWLMVEG